MSDEAPWSGRPSTTEGFASLSLRPEGPGGLRPCGGGHTVGFLGDGINDAAAMRGGGHRDSGGYGGRHRQESADIILLVQDLMVLERGSWRAAARPLQHDQIHQDGRLLQLPEHMFPCWRPLGPCALPALWRASI